MIDLDKIDESLLIARGQYSTVRSEHEDAKKSLATMCGELSSCATRILKRLQPDNDAVPESVEELIASAKSSIDAIELCVSNITSLAQQRAKLRPIAWPRN